MDHVTLGLGLG